MSITIDNKGSFLPAILPNEKYQGNKEQDKAGISANEYISKDTLDKALEKINTFLDDNNTYAEYEMHDKLKHIMIRIVHKDTHEILLEIPPKKILDLVSKMCELVGILVDEKV
ncbi:MAG: flagellar protein FlaG [Clostridiaceae bacterium]|uniref:flagellar protein FlaG n=1 Tax=Alloiococcus sp. CFN-8 TaxID=3416081 RepID=UPI003CEC37DC